MIRHKTTKIYKAQGENKRNELCDRFERLQAKKAEVSRIKPGIAEGAMSSESAEVGLPKSTKDGNAERDMYERAGIHWYQHLEESEGERAERLHFGTRCDIGRHGKLASAGLAECTEDEPETEYEAQNENGKAVRSRSIV